MAIRSKDNQQLVFQKEMLLSVMTNSTDDSTEDEANSLIHLVDALQDCAAELYGEEKVFLFEKKAEYLLKYRQYCNDNSIRDDSYEISTRHLFNFVDYEIVPNEDE